MKSALFVLVALAGLMTHDASARDKESIDTNIKLSSDPPVRLADRHDVDDARFAIATDSRKMVLLLTNRVVAMQLSDRTFRNISRKMKEAKEEDEGGPFGKAIKTAVLAGVKSLLSHSAECDIRDIAKADYRDGELILTSRSGKRIFADAEVDDEKVMRSFAESDARAFVRQLRQRMGRSS